MQTSVLFMRTKGLFFLHEINLDHYFIGIVIFIMADSQYVFDTKRPHVKERALGIAHEIPEFSIRYIKSLFPIFSWIHHYNLTWFVSDIIAGITIGLVVIPQSMGYAKIATLPVEYGLYSSFVGVSIYCFFATSKDITIGPTAVMSLLMGQTIDSILKVNTNYANTAIAATFSLLTGFVALTMGLLRLGFVVDFIPVPVVAGFTTGSAINIAVVVASQELIAIGATNALGSFFGAYPSTGSFSRSAINAKSGVRTPLAVLLVRLARPRFDVLGRLEIASSNGDGSKQFTYVPLCPMFQTAQSPPDGVLIFRFDESLTYPNSSYIEDQIVNHVKSNTRRVTKIAEKVGDRPWNDASDEYENKVIENLKLPKLKAIVFDFSAVSTIDSTGVQALVDIKKNLNRYTGDIIEYHFANILNEKIQRALIVAGFGGTEQPKLVIDVGIHSTEESSDENSELTPNEIDMPSEVIVNTVRKKYLHLSLQEAVTAATNGVW
ncbi:3351_t:CDS:2 [Racocetra fulgida]|uniref:3351_t:CDS:1 n=1 Tax=Racocetra fulgida TaxID=60492 RepID=A0A9N8ZBP7_9GLOM|nr:3351_t:CDS:2 [Racocetra fulgida]